MVFTRYINLRRNKIRAKCASMRDAKARKRMAEPGPGWTIHEQLLRFAVSPDGRHVALQMQGGWYRCGSERTIRSKLAKAIYRTKERSANGRIHI